MKNHQLLATLFALLSLASWPAAASAQDVRNGPVTTRPVAGAQREEEARARASMRKAKADAMIREADRLKQLYAQNPTASRAPEIRRLEAKALIEAAREGDASQADRLVALIESVRRDPGLPEAKRCEIVALRHYQQANFGHLNKDDDRFATIERIERGLIAEFPAAPNGYEALYRLALHSDDNKGKALAEEIANMPGAPAFVKAEVNRLQSRYALIGVALKDLLPVDAGAAAASRDKAEVVVYAWASTDHGSMNFARFLANRTRPGMHLIGVCLDPDEVKGRATAQAEGLVGEQLYDPTGALAVRLRFDPGPMAYIAGPDGLIRTVNGVRELTRQSFSALRSRNDQPREGK